MRYFFTRTVRRIYLATLGIFELLAIIGLFTQSVLAFFLIPMFVMFFGLYPLDDYKPPQLGEIRYKHINYYQPIVWNGKEWT